MFKWFKKKFKKEDKKEMTTLEEIRKAYEDLSDDDKKMFKQSISDSAHESAPAQERADGNEGSSAEASEPEALGAEHADGKGNVEELHEKDDAPEEKGENKADENHEARRDDGMRAVLERLDKLEARFAEADKNVLEEKKQKYGLSSNHVPQAHDEEFDEQRINKLLGK